jgi:DNA polymerase-1
LGQELAVIETKIHEIAGEKFNIGSPKQLGVILFEKLGLEALKKTKTGYSTDNDVLEKLQHPIAQQVIEYRELAKLKSTYVDALPELVDENHRVHGSFNQALTATGRLSSTAPNLQNIPIKTEKGQIVRQCFIADEGQKLLSLDYSQIELRVLAHISQDKNLIQAFADDLDIHQATAAEVFSISLKEVTKEQRRIAKAVNFGIAYGQGAFGLAETLGISRTESKEIIEKYFNRFSGIKEYIDTTIEQAHKNKYVETLFGRKRYIDELNSINVMVKKFGERAAINAPIQGTASDLMKLAMIDIAKNISLKLILQVHDELIFEGTEEEIIKNLPKIKYKMENVAKLKVPLKVNHALGNNWDQSH